MKLSQPASSSDIDAAREAAQRLNRVATPPEPARPLPPYAPVGAFRTAEPTRPAPAPPLPPPAPSTRSAAEVAPPLTDWRRHSEPQPEPPPLPEREEEPADEPSTEVSAPEPAPSIEVSAPAAEPEVDGTPEPAAPPPSPAAAAEPEPPAPPPAPVHVAPTEVLEEESLGVVDDGSSTATLSWPEVTRSCLVLAEAKGTLLITPEGRVIAVAGDWPAPGAEAIASRLVPAMDKALKDAPTRSVSVPLGGLHLTAWRVPIAAGGLMTVGFVADAPLRPDLRPAIDAELRKGSDA